MKNLTSRSILEGPNNGVAFGKERRLQWTPTYSPPPAPPPHLTSQEREEQSGVDAIKYLVLQLNRGPIDRFMVRMTY